MSKNKRRSINPRARERRPKVRRELPDVSDLIKAITAGDRVALGQAITFIESEKEDHQSLARELVDQCLAYKDYSIRIGITGSPGVGKSTFIEALGKHLTKQEKKVAVLAIDPSSQVSGGSILGDKTRMGSLSTDRLAFIRPSPAGKNLGGVARKTRETIIICEAAGYDHILIETVGVGQSEIAVHSMVDCFLLLLLPGAGDDLQGIKRGIVEMADLIVVNKADGGRETMAKEAMKAYQNALHLFPPKENNWIPKVITASAQHAVGIDQVWEAIGAFYQHTQQNGTFAENRRHQAKYWLTESIEQQLKKSFYENPLINQHLKELELQVLQQNLSPFRAAELLLEQFRRFNRNTDM